jgi:formate dehydrogenase major subunit
MTKRQLEIALR